MSQHESGLAFQSPEWPVNQSHCKGLRTSEHFQLVLMLQHRHVHSHMGMPSMNIQVESGYSLYRVLHLLPVSMEVSPPSLL